MELLPLGLLLTMAQRMELCLQVYPSSATAQEGLRCS